MWSFYNAFRFTVVCALAPSACVDVEKIWKSHKYIEVNERISILEKDHELRFH